MLHLPVLRWGEPHESLDTQEVLHFATGEPVARVSQSVPGMVARDLRRAKRARAALRAVPFGELVGMAARAGELYAEATLEVGGAEQSPEEFARLQSATTGLPEHLCRANMAKNRFVLENMGAILDALSRGLDLEILRRGFGVEERGVVVSYQAQADAVGMVLPSNSPGVHTLWLPILPLGVGLVLKPGPQEPWTPYRMAAAFAAAGMPREAISIHPGGAEVGAAVVQRCERTMLFGGRPTVEAYRGDPRVQVHGPGYTKILLGDDVVDDWERYLDLMERSVFANSGRGCINCSGIWASRHTEEIAAALAERLGPVEPRPPQDPEAALAAFPVEGQARAIAAGIRRDLETPGATDMTARFGERLVEHERHAYLRPWIVHCEGPEHPLANTEFLFPFASVVRCPQEHMLEAIGPTLVATAITEDEAFGRELLDATCIDRLNLGPIPTVELNWLQPHEGNVVDFLYRARSLQMPAERLERALRAE